MWMYEFPYIHHISYTYVYIYIYQIYIIHLSGWWCSTLTLLLICSSFSREYGHPLLICSSLSTAQLYRYIYIYIQKTASESAIMIIIGVDHRNQEPKRRNITKTGPKTNPAEIYPIQLPHLPVHARRPPLSRALAPV